MDEVRYHLLRPAQIVARREACPVVYIPIGTIEWHGTHNPTGADTLQAETLALMAARRGGGLVFPPLYYGESRLEALMESSSADGTLIAEKMHLPGENFSAARQPFSATEQALNYHKLLLHILAEAESLGFAVGVLVAGHYPLIDHARSAVLTFNKREHSRIQGMLAWACVDYLLVRDRFPQSGDHAGKWETSHMMYSHPETVDLSTLPPQGERLIGATMNAHEATAEFGKQAFEAAADSVVNEVRHRLTHRQTYLRHGMSLAEGLWKGGK